MTGRRRVRGEMGRQTRKQTRRQTWKQLVISHLFLAVLVYLIVFVPNARPTVRGCVPLLAGLAVIELFYLYHVCKDRDEPGGAGDIILFVWIAMIVWECATSVFNVAHPVLVPAPENVFDTFRSQWRTMLLNVLYSMELLLTGFFAGHILAVALGLFAGWIPRMRRFFCPIANVMAPIPAVVFSPYLVALMPSFRSASVLVIVLGVFWPAFLTTVGRVMSMDQELLDSAWMLCPGTFTMVGRILLPYVMPGILSGLKVSMTTSLLMLSYAELMGATHGMGYYVQNSITYANYSHAVAGIFVIGMVVTVLSRIVGQVQERLIRWK